MDSLEYAAIIGIELEPVSFCGRKSVFVTKTGRTAVKSYPEHLAQPSSDHRIIGSRNHRIMGSLDHWDHGIMGSRDHQIMGSSGTLLALLFELSLEHSNKLLMLLLLRT